MKLFYSPGVCSLSPHIVLEEGGFSYDLEKVDLKNKTLADGGDFRAIAPKGSVPVLQLDNGEVLTEGPAIVQYIADQAPGTALAPAAGTIERYRLVEWLNFISSELHKGYSPLFKATTPDSYKTTANENLVAKYATVEKQLAKGQYLLGDHFTVADAYLFTVTRWSVPAKVDLSRYANVGSYMQRVAARPKVTAAMKQEGLS